MAQTRHHRVMLAIVASVLNVQNGHTRGRQQRLADVAGIVWAAVVHQHDLQSADGPQFRQRIDQPPYRGRATIDGNDDRESDLAHSFGEYLVLGFPHATQEVIEPLPMSRMVAATWATSASVRSGNIGRLSTCADTVSLSTQPDGPRATRPR